MQRARELTKPPTAEQVLERCRNRLANLSPFDRRRVVAELQNWVGE
jgi:hypothetical protein